MCASHVLNLWGFLLLIWGGRRRTLKFIERRRVISDGFRWCHALHSLWLPMSSVFTATQAFSGLYSCYSSFWIAVRRCSYEGLCFWDVLPQLLHTVNQGFYKHGQDHPSADDRPSRPGNEGFWTFFCNKTKGCFSYPMAQGKKVYEGINIPYRCQSHKHPRDFSATKVNTQDLLEGSKCVG